MTLSLIAAMSDNRVIGINNTLPWKLPADMKHFRAMTMGKPIVMGRKTFESIGKALPGRTNIIVTHDPNFVANGCTVAHSLEQALALAGGENEVMVIGGASFYAQTITCADRLYLTLIHETFDGDAWFPEWDPTQWRETARSDHEPDAGNPHAYSFIVMQRITHLP